MSEKIVGHKTYLNDDGITFRHEPLYEGEADKLLAQIEVDDKRRAEAMPDEQAAIRQMFDAWRRLKDFGWREPMYCPKDGSEFLIIEAGSTGIFSCNYMGEWPDGSYVSHDEHDSYPANPAMFKPKT